MNVDTSMARARFGIYLLNQNPEYDYARHQQEGICLVLEQLEAGKFAADSNMAAIHAPPRMGKSETASVHFPAWYLGRNPKHNVMVVTASSDLATSFGRKTRNLIESPKHTAIFPKCKISWDSRAKDDFALTEGGNYYAFGIDGQITGKGGHLIILDDWIKSSKDAQSEASESFRREIFNSVIFPRLEPGGKLLLVMTKWPGDSFSPWLMEKFGSREITQDELKQWRMAA